MAPKIKYSPTPDKNPAVTGKGIYQTKPPNLTTPSTQNPRPIEKAERDNPATSVANIASGLALPAMRSTRVVANMANIAAGTSCTVEIAPRYELSSAEMRPIIKAPCKKKAAALGTNLASSPVKISDA